MNHAPLAPRPAGFGRRPLPGWLTWKRLLAALLLLIGSVLFRTFVFPKEPVFFFALMFLSGSFLLVAILLWMFRTFCRREWLRYYVFGAACFVTLLALFYAVENRRGRQAWEEYRARLEAKGFKLDYADWQPPAVPDAENFYTAPLLKKHGYKPMTPLPPGFANGMEVFGRAGGVAGEISTHYPALTAGTACDYPAIQSLLRDRRLSGKTGPLAFTNLPALPASPGQDMLAVMDDIRPVLDELRQASLRPQAQTAWRPFGLTGDIPNFIFLRGVAQTMAAQAYAELETGRPAAALADARVLQQVRRAMTDDPTLVSTMIGVAIEGIHSGVFWEGWSRRQWSAEQLAAFQKYFLAQNGVASVYNSVAGGECAGLGALVTELPPREVISTFFYTQPKDSWEKRLLPRLGAVVPHGWFYQNRLAATRFLYEHVLNNLDPATPTVTPARLAEIQIAMEKELTHWTPYNVVLMVSVPSFTRAFQTIACNQSYVQMAGITCALERYRLENGAYPVRLADLAPKFITKVPVDVINGGDYHYRTTDDGQFLLYSVGWNEKDDGGQRVPDSKKFAAGDWVWCFPTK